MALVREPFEFTMVYNDTLTKSKEGRTLVKRLIQTITQTMKGHDEHWNLLQQGAVWSPRRA